MLDSVSEATIGTPCIFGIRSHSHCVVGMQKLGKLTKVQKVYRGISGGVLPDEFWNRNEFNVRGGVEFAFTST